MLYLLLYSADHSRSQARNGGGRGAIVLSGVWGMMTKDLITSFLLLLLLFLVRVTWEGERNDLPLRVFINWLKQFSSTRTDSQAQDTTLGIFRIFPKDLFRCFVDHGALLRLGLTLALKARIRNNTRIV
jgi:hypothetical protein